MGAKNKWQEALEIAKRHEPGASQWFKLTNDGDKAVVVFLGEPYPREVCFVDGKYTPYDDRLRAQGRRPSLRVALNIALYDTKQVKVFEQGVVLFSDLVQLRAKYGFDAWAFEVKRHGAETCDPSDARGADGAKENGARVDPQRAQAIALRLRALPKEAGERFCQRFGIARLTDLPARKVEQAVAYVDMITAAVDA